MGLYGVDSPLPGWFYEPIAMESGVCCGSARLSGHIQPSSVRPLLSHLEEIPSLSLVQPAAGGNDLMARDAFAQRAGDPGALPMGWRSVPSISARSPVSFPHRCATRKDSATCWQNCSGKSGWPSSRMFPAGSISRNAAASTGEPGGSYVLSVNSALGERSTISRANSGSSSAP